MVGPCGHNDLLYIGPARCGFAFTGASPESGDDLDISAHRRQGLRDDRHWDR